MPIDPEALAYRYPCPYCKTPWGLPCVTASGNRASSMHRDRVQPIYDALAEGYRQGERDGMHEALRDPVGARRRLEKP